MDNPLEQLVAEAHEGDQVSLVLVPRPLSCEDDPASYQGHKWVFTGVFRRSTREGHTPAKYCLDHNTGNIHGMTDLNVDGRYVTGDVMDLEENRSGVLYYVINGNVAHLLE